MDRLRLPSAQASFVSLSTKEEPGLPEREIGELFNCLDDDRDGYVSCDDLKKRIRQILEESGRSGRQDIEEKLHDSLDVDALLRSLLLPNQERFGWAEFAQCARQWPVSTPNSEQSRASGKSQRLPWSRWIRAYWAVHGLNIMFIAFVVAAQLGFGLWQMMIYVNDPLAQAALGWGIIVAKFCAGALYPTLAFMLLSMSRHLNTLLRRSYVLSRFINFDHSRQFHIAMAMTALVLGTTHGLAHLTGDMVYASKAAQFEAVDEYFGEGNIPRSYAGKMRLLPAVTGVSALGIFWLMAMLSMPIVRRRHFEIFQLSHLLMIPIVGLLCAHGTAAILQKPMLGYWLVGPAFLILSERALRLGRGLRPVMATTTILDGQASVVACRHPQGRNWRYRVGQYILIQVPAISVFQWHPFTVSSCRGDILEVHIKKSGDWTESLRALPENEKFRIGIDGPFGAPAQRFYDYDYSLVIGNGIGVTPCSAILSDIEDKFVSRKDPWMENRSSRLQLARPMSLYSRWEHSRSKSSRIGTSLAASLACRDDESQQYPGSSGSSTPTLRTASTQSPSTCVSTKSSFEHLSPEQRVARRVDVHWTVRETQSLSWFADLLNRAIDRAEQLSQYSVLDLKINTHITGGWKDLATHVIASLIDGHRDQTTRVSALTGLRHRSRFGRPDFENILQKHFEDLLHEISKEVLHVGIRAKRVGVFYCGTPVVGQHLSDLCRQLTAQARHMGLKVTYDFHTEVFD